MTTHAPWQYTLKHHSQVQSTQEGRRRKGCSAKVIQKHLSTSLVHRPTRAKNAEKGLVALCKIPKSTALILGGRIMFVYYQLMHSN